MFRSLVVLTALLLVGCSFARAANPPKPVWNADSSWATCPAGWYFADGWGTCEHGRDPRLSKDGKWWTPFPLLAAREMEEGTTEMWSVEHLKIHGKWVWRVGGGSDDGWTNATFYKQAPTLKEAVLEYAATEHDHR
jgi:hypothetical protein